MLTDANPLPDGLPDDLRRQLEFVLELDQMKAVLRDTVIPSVDRRENDAEHSWHLCLMAVVLSQHANEPVDLGRVLTLLTVHDLVEIYAGDTPLHLADESQHARELEAADQLFPLLPEPQATDLRAAWEEFEAHITAEARFARSLDRLQPLLLEWMHKGQRWQGRETNTSDLRGRLGIIGDGSSTLWDAAQTFIDAAEARGYLRRPQAPPLAD
jgi:putative hydrolase of HD superfamily